MKRAPGLYVSRCRSACDRGLDTSFAALHYAAFVAGGQTQVARALVAFFESAYTRQCAKAGNVELAWSQFANERREGAMSPIALVELTDQDGYVSADPDAALTSGREDRPPSLPTARARAGS